MLDPIVYYSPETAIFSTIAQSFSERGTLDPEKFYLILDWKAPRTRPRKREWAAISQRFSVQKEGLEHGALPGVNARRKTIPFARFDAKRCAQGLEARRSYRTEWDEKARAFKKTPEHNWAPMAQMLGGICLCPGAPRCANRSRRRCRSAFRCRI